MVSPGPGQRPCPYCGTWNDSAFSFCAKCGKPLPLSTAASAPSAPTGFAFPPPFDAATVTPPTTEESPATERPLTPEEREALTKALAAGKGASLRGAASVCGVLLLTCVGLAFGGILTDLWVYFPIVVVLGIAGLALGTTARREREPIQRALADGNAVELRGVPEIGSPDGTDIRVDVGGVSLRLRSDQAGRLLLGRMNRIVIVDGGPGVGPDRRPGSHLAIVLEWNGTATTTLERCRVADLGASAAPAGSTGLLASQAGGGAS